MFLQFIILVVNCLIDSTPGLYEQLDMENNKGLLNKAKKVHSDKLLSSTNKALFESSLKNSSQINNKKEKLSNLVNQVTKTPEEKKDLRKSTMFLTISVVIAILVISVISLKECA